MPQRRKLPLAFWLLLLAAIAVALVLIVGTVLETKSKSPPPTPTPSAASGAPAREETAAAAAASGKTLSCQVRELSLTGGETLKASRLVGWGAEPYQLTVWAYEPKSLKLTKYTLGNLSGDSAGLTSSESQSLQCEGPQAPGCLFLGAEASNGRTAEAEQITDLWLQNEMGLAFVSPIGKIEQSKLVMARISNGRLTFHETLGLCGQSLRTLPDQLSAQVEGNDEHRSLRVFEWGSGGLFKYETLGANSYSRNETALHPTVAQQASSEGLLDINCRDLLKEPEGARKAFAIRDVQSRRGRLALIASGKKTFDSDQEIWVLNASDSHLALSNRLTSAKLEFTPGGLMFETPDSLLVSSSNFFQTKASSKAIDLLSGEIRESLFSGAWPGEALIARENQIAKSVPQPNADLLFVYQDSKKVAGAVKIGTSIVPLPGAFAPEEKPRLLVSNRGVNDWLILYQGVRSEEPRIARITCSK